LRTRNAISAFFWSHAVDLLAGSQPILHDSLTFSTLLVGAWQFDGCRAVSFADARGRFLEKRNSPMKPSVAFADPVSVAFKYHRFHPDLVEQLVSIYRIMFPHNAVPDEFYEHVVRKLDENAAQDQAFSCFLSNGVEALNHQTGSMWTSLSEEARLQALKRAEQTPFFQRLRSDFVVYFYSNPAIWPRFGYEGPSNDQGGYLYRGFNDIDWIKMEDL
jgi:hypothetical protein